MALCKNKCLIFWRQKYNNKKELKMGKSAEGGFGRVAYIAVVQILLCWRHFIRLLSFFNM